MSVRTNCLNTTFTYISKIEYAPLTGWHCHMVLFFNGQRVQNDIVYANSICRYWENVITKGIGRAYSSNLARMNEKHMAI